MPDRESGEVHSQAAALQERDCQSCHNDAYHRHELDEDIKRRAGGVLERVAHGVADDGSLVILAALAFEESLLYHLFSVIPCTTGV